jgi:hypothetical protein
VLIGGGSHAIPSLSASRWGEYPLSPRGIELAPAARAAAQLRKGPDAVVSPLLLPDALETRVQIGEHE